MVKATSFEVINITLCYHVQNIMPLSTQTTFVAAAGVCFQSLPTLSYKLFRIVRWYLPTTTTCSGSCTTTICIGPSSAPRRAAGLDSAIASLRPGQTARVMLPPDFAYGARGFPPLVPPNTSLICTVELLSSLGLAPSPDSDRIIRAPLQVALTRERRPAGAGGGGPSSLSAAS